MKIAVTGAKGFIGSVLVPILSAAGHEVVPVDKALGVDISDSEALTDAFAGCDRVVHLAALMDESAPFDQLFATNVLGTLNVVQAAAAAKVSRVVHASTCAVYHLRGPYAGTKAAAESLLRSRTRSLGIDSVCLRLFNVYGPTQTRSHGALIPTIIDNIKHNRETLVHGVGVQTRDFIYIDDVVEAFKRAVELDQPLQYVAFDVGTGWSSRVLIVVHMLYRIAGRQPQVRFVDAPAYMSLRARANTAMLLDRLGMTSLTKLQGGLENVWRAHNAVPASTNPNKAA